ncbi:glycosyltransferase [Halochromatium glycolicum]|uniref:glycosyltransferase n=1 Tax=Halochromatium glycolicum TaxID=85075 RepID=UPI00190DCE26
MSVIIPCYEGEAFIADAIRSALDQQDVTLEVVVVDDASPDGSASVVEGFLDTDHVRLLRRRRNGGIAAARNTGICSAAGEYIAFLDQDDLWYPGRLSKAVKILDNDKDIGLVFGNETTRSFATGANETSRLRPPADINCRSRDAVLAALLQRNFIPTAASLVRRTCFNELGLLNESIRSGVDDFDLFVRIAGRYKILHIDELQAVRRIHGRNYTRLQRMVPDMLEILETAAAARPAVASVAGHARGQYLYLLAKEQHLEGRYDEAIASYWRSVKAAPPNFVALATMLVCAFGPAGNVPLSILRKTNRWLRRRGS